MKNKIEVRSQKQAIHTESATFYTFDIITLKSLQKEQKQQLKKMQKPHVDITLLFYCITPFNTSSK